jgi:hypothetical protein
MSADFILGKQSFMQLCEGMLVPQDTIKNCEGSWDPYAEAMRDEFARRMGPDGFTLDLGDGKDIPGSDPGAARIFDEAQNAVLSRWREWMVRSRRRSR